MTDSIDVAHALEQSNVLRVSVYGTQLRGMGNQELP